MLTVSCNTQYVRHESTSPKKFLNDIKSNLSGKEIKVTLLNDSTFIADEFSQNEDEIILKYPSFSDEKKIPVSDVKGINYQKYAADNLSAVIE
jgi:hypothetical protein